MFSEESTLQVDPLMVSIHPNGSKLTDNQRFDMLGYLSKVSEETYQLLASLLVAESLLRMQQSLSLSDSEILRIASLLRMYYFGKAPFERFPEFLRNDVGLSQDKIPAVINFIRTEIFTLKAPQKIEDDDGEDVVRQSNFISMALFDALVKYPKINDQQITGERIRIRSEKDTVRGTVRNWLRAYRDVVGVRKHEAMERGQFLFQSENAKRLPQSERDRVALLLKSLDESEPLSINADRQEIIFPAMSNSTRASQNSPLASEAVRAESPNPEPSMDRPFVTASTLVVNPSREQNQTQTRVAPAATTHEATHTPRMQASPMKSFNFSKAALGGAAQNQAQAQPSSAPSAQEYRKPAAPVQAPAPRPQQESPAFPAANQFRFSSGHMLPSEKSALAEREALRAPKASPAQRSFGSPSYDNRPDASRVMRPETMVPRGLPVQPRKKEVWQVPASLGNVVDLRPDNE